jgi:hypothetical protein
MVEVKIKIYIKEKKKDGATGTVPASNTGTVPASDTGSVPRMNYQ